MQETLLPILCVEPFDPCAVSDVIQHLPKVFRLACFYEILDLFLFRAAILTQEEFIYIFVLNPGTPVFPINEEVMNRKNTYTSEYLIYSEESFVGFFLEGGILSSYILFTFLFPIPANKSRTSGSRESRVRDLTLDTPTPKDL